MCIGVPIKKKREMDICYDYSFCSTQWKEVAKSCTKSPLDTTGFQHRNTLVGMGGVSTF